MLQCLDDREMTIDFYQRLTACYAKDSFVPETVTTCIGHYVSDEFADFYTDILYRAKLKNAPDDSHGYIYLLCEHKSVAEKTTNIQLATYMMNIALKHLKDHPKSKFPVIMPMVLYHGQKTPYPYPLNCLSIFEDPDNLMGQVFSNPIHLVDLNTFPDEQLKQFKLVGVMSRLLKHIRDPDLDKKLPAILNDAVEAVFLLSGDGQNAVLDEKVLHFIRNSLAYAFTAAPELKEKRIINELIGRTAEPIRNEIMSLADVLREEGREEGREARDTEIAIQMLREGSDDRFILKVLKISQQQLDEIKQSLYT